MAALDYIPAGTSIRFEVTGSADGFDDDDTQTAVRSQLSKYFGVQRVYLDAPALSGVYSGWPFTAEIVITTREAYGDVSGPASIVAHAIYEATGYMPAVSAPSYGGPAQSDPSVIDGSGIGDLLKQGANDLSTTIGEALRNLLQPTAEGAVSVLMPLVIVVAVVAVVLVVNVGGKTTRVGLS